MDAKLAASHCCVNDGRPICFLVMKPNYPGWDQKSLAMVFCDFYLTAEIMAPSSHRQMRMWTELVTNERDLEQKVPCLGWRQGSAGAGVRPCTGLMLLQMCKWGLAPLTVMELEPVFLSKNGGLSFSNQKEGISLGIRKRAMSPNFCILSQFTN